MQRGGLLIYGRSIVQSIFKDFTPKRSCKLVTFCQNSALLEQWNPLTCEPKIYAVTCVYKRELYKIYRRVGEFSLIAANIRVKTLELEDKMTIPCMVCFLETNEISIRSWCCSGVICLACLEAHVQSKIEDAIVKIVCPLGNCDTLINDDEVEQLVSDSLFEKYQQFKVEIEQNPLIKTCPGCSRIHHHQELSSLTMDINSTTDEEKDGTPPEDLKVACSKCQLVWCFACQAPWHYGLTCKEFCKGDQSLKIWAKNRGQSVRNACRCPKCHVFIQKSSGCDHMSCSRCHTEFCYRCGGKYHHLKFLGNHYDRYSILGCKFNFKPDKPVQRMAVRGALFSGQVMIIPVVAGLAISAGCAILGAGVVAAPFYGSYVLIKKQRAKSKQAHQSKKK